MLDMFFVLLVAIPLDLVAIGVFTGHTERFLRALPGNNLRWWDSALGGKGVGCFLRFWAILAFGVTSIVLLAMVGYMVAAVKQ